MNCRILRLFAVKFHNITVKGSFARVVELADTPDLGSGAAGLRVQVPSLAELEQQRGQQ